MHEEDDDDDDDESVYIKAVHEVTTDEYDVVSDSVFTSSSSSPDLGADHERRCQGCDQLLAPGSLAVFADQAPDSCWHSACFTCTSCSLTLTSHLYYYSSGELFCGRCYTHHLGLNRCSACDELILSDEYVETDHHCWHHQHFSCWGCDSNLTEKSYLMLDNNQPCCETCLSKNFSRTCSACGLRIR